MRSPRTWLLGLCAVLGTSALAAVATHAQAGVSALVQVVPDAPTNLAVIARRSTTVTLAWQAPPSGPPPTAYVVEGGLAPGEVLGSLPLAGTDTVVTFDAPAGNFLVRVHAIVGTERSVASNEVALLLGDVAPPPAAPANLLGLADGDRLALSWTTSLDGGPVARLWLHVSGDANATLPVPTGEAFSFAGVPPGSYTFMLTASNDAGHSAASNAVALSFPDACAAAPQPPTGFRAWRSGGQLSIAWNAPATGTAVSTYRVQVSGAIALSFDTSERLVSAPAPPGQYAITVASVNACGVSGPASPSPDWTAVTRTGTTHTVSWRPVPGVDVYRVFWADSRAAVDALAPDLPFVDVAATRVQLPSPSPTAQTYYRVFSVAGPVVTGGGGVAAPPMFTTFDTPDWGGGTTPAVWDLNNDGCLDLVGGWGHCDGTFSPYALTNAGMGALHLAGAVNRDSRVADFTGDGIADIFTNIYDRADTTGVSASLLVGDGLGGFTDDPGIAAMQIRGFGETVVAADLDNDGDLDIFLPHYTHVNDGGHNWLLINDGAGHFTDVAQAAGLAFNPYGPPEGAQALDLNQDGWLDLLFASHLYVNNGDLTFTDVAPDMHLPILFDEGLRLFDVDLDGDLDLIHSDSEVAQLFLNQAGRFDDGRVVSGTHDGSSYGYGLNVCDVNADGFEDVLVARNTRANSTGQPVLLLNVGGTLEPSDLTDSPAVYNDLSACGDFDGNGLPDVVHRWSAVSLGTNGNLTDTARFRTYMSQGTPGGSIRVRVTDGHGALNQQGRAVRVRPLQGPAVTLLRTVESGSGYMAQNPYDLTIATPWACVYEVAVRFAGGWVTATAVPGDVLTVQADGTVLRQ